MCFHSLGFVRLISLAVCINSRDKIRRVHEKCYLLPPPETSMGAKIDAQINSDSVYVQGVKE